MKMFIKLTCFFLILFVANAEKEDSEWDLAVAINDQVEFLTSNGTLLGSAVQQFSNLRAITFDSIRHEFVVSDTDQKNDTIYSVQLTEETEVTPIVQDLPDDIQGLAIDPITDILYWTDTVNRSINYVSLQDPNHISKVLLEFKDSKPQDIAIDICLRYIYWTNSDLIHPTIERATVEGQNHEVLISDDLFMPKGIAIDHILGRIIWADKREGIYYRIESANFDGSDRQVIFEGTHQKPFGIAVDKDAVYWTDTNNNALWKKKKKENMQPEKLRHFNENPMGIITKNLNIIKNLSECNNFKEALESYNGLTKEHIDTSPKETDEVLDCFNGGELINDVCICLQGYSGLRCETSKCHNFCLHGICQLSSLGYPQCQCSDGYRGIRCENDVCDGLCLNGGRCIRSKNVTEFCDCPRGFMGARCETSRNPTELCKLFCTEKVSDMLVDQSNTFICRCEQGKYILSENQDDLPIFKLQTSRWYKEDGNFKDAICVSLSVFLVIAFVVIISLSVCVCKLRRRPRIKKRIIVNKNITPLTYRPQSTTQQCEITIENCCNMNVCETPCFEPPALRGFQSSRKDEKKILLANMELGENLY